MVYSVEDQKKYRASQDLLNAYFDLHPCARSALTVIEKTVRKYFGYECLISVDILQDPEDCEFTLIVYIHQTWDKEEEASATLAALIDEWWINNLDLTSASIVIDIFFTD